MIREVIKMKIRCIDNLSQGFYLGYININQNKIDIKLIKKNILLYKDIEIPVRIVFAGWPFSNRDKLEVKCNSQAFKWRICRDGTTSWEYFDFELDAVTKSAKISPVFKEKHDGFRIELLDASLIKVGEVVDLQLSFTHNIKSSNTQIIMHNRALNKYSDTLQNICHGKDIINDLKQLPNVLILDFTLLGSNSATGQIKKMLFENWKDEQIFQVYLSKDGLRGCYPKKKNSQTYINKIYEEIDKFQYNVIYFRVTDHHLMFNFFHKLNKKNKKIVTHIMDDWIKRLEQNDPDSYSYFHNELKIIFSKADINLSICNEMSVEYKKRYGYDFTAISNGVDISKFLPRDWKNRASIDNKNPIVIRYMGGLAQDMCFKSIKEFAKIISKISKNYPVKLEIYTMDWYLKEANNFIGHYKNISILPLVEESKYANLLSSSDLLLVAYNFDEITLAYVGFSFANKLPEVLATGMPIIAIGNKQIPTISYLDKLDFVNTISSLENLTEEYILNILNNLFFNIYDSDRLNNLSKISRQYVSQYLSKNAKQDLFEKCFTLNSAGQKINSPSKTKIYSLEEANSIYRKGNYKEALEIYEVLYQQNQLEIYKMNIERTKKVLLWGELVKCIK